MKKPTLETLWRLAVLILLALILHRLIAIDDTIYTSCRNIEYRID